MTQVKFQYSLQPAKNGQKTIIVQSAAGPVPLHSKYNPLRESAGFPESVLQQQPDCLVVLGCGLGYQLLPLQKTITGYELIIIIEILDNIEQAIQNNQETSFLCRHENITFLSGMHFAEVTEKVTKILSAASPKKITFIEHATSLRIFPDYYINIKEAILQFINKQVSNSATQKAFGYRFIKNILQNCDYLYNYTSVKHLFDNFNKYPVLVVTSGPSLDRYIPEIKKNQHNTFIIAVDSALAPLQSSGITPDFIVSIDPQPYIAEHFLGKNPDRSIKILSISASPHVFASTSGFLSLNTHPLAQILAQGLPDHGSIDSKTGSVAGDAIELAVQGNFKAIGLIGFDFSFLRYSIYARGSAYQNRYSLFFHNRFNTVETRNFNYIMRSCNGFTVSGKYSRKSFLHYKQGLEKLISQYADRGIKSINEYGLPINGLPTSGFNRFIDDYCTEKLDKYSILTQIQKQAQTKQQQYPNPKNLILTALQSQDIFEEFMTLIGSSSMKTATIDKIKKLTRRNSN